MIAVTVYRRNGAYQGLCAEGHAGYAEAGEDIFCAAASALLINTVNSIEALAGDSVSADEKDGYLKCSFPDGLSGKGTLLMDSLILGIRQMEESADPDTGKPYVRLFFEEV
jgi:uncharacterized protein YsxB (DUF464 family)